MKKEDIKELTTEELLVRVDEDKFLYTKMRFNHSASPMENPMKLKAMRKVIARLITEIKLRELSGGIKVIEEAKRAVKNITPASAKKTAEKPAKKAAAKVKKAPAAKADKKKSEVSTEEKTSEEKKK